MIEKEIDIRIKELTKNLKDINHFLESAPVGCLKTQQRDGKHYFYHQVFDQETHQFSRTYISRKDVNLAGELAKKGYFLKIKPIIEKQLNALKRFSEEYRSREIDYEYDRLSEVRRALVNPIQRSTKSIMECWNNEVYEPNNKYPENMRYETDNGELVRSKSELIIANALAREKEHLLYKYERPIKLVINGAEQIFHPDFTVLNIHTGKISYWEHAGKMDDSFYANDFVAKMNIYQTNRIIPGKNLLITYETRENPLSMQNVRCCIGYLKEMSW